MCVLTVLKSVSCPGSSAGNGWQGLLTGTSQFPWTRTQPPVVIAGKRFYSRASRGWQEIRVGGLWAPAAPLTGEGVCLTVRKDSDHLWTEGGWLCPVGKGHQGCRGREGASKVSCRAWTFPGRSLASDQDLKHHHSFLIASQKMACCVSLCVKKCSFKT